MRSYRTLSLSFVAALLAVSVTRGAPPPPAGAAPTRDRPTIRIPIPIAAPAAPTGFAAQHLGGGTVNLSWQPAAGASQYHLEGSGIAPPGINVAGTTASLQGVPAGPDSWRITSIAASGAADPQLSATTSMMVRYVPPHSLRWLTKNNGAGDAQTTAAHYAGICAMNPNDCFTAVRGSHALWGDPSSANAEAVYGNVTDLGFGRRTRCFMDNRTLPYPGLYFLCYATNHGVGPGQPGFADPATITRAAAGEDPPLPATNPLCYTDPADHFGYPAPPCNKNPWGSLPRTTSVILKTPVGMQFMVMSVGVPPLAVASAYDAGPGWSDLPKPLTTVTLDTEGPKQVPHACLSCHGGIYDRSTGYVQGASLLPIDPNMMVFGTTQPGDRTHYERATQEELIRQTNLIVLLSQPSPAITAFIKGLYPGGVGQQGGTAQVDYVPSGWRDQAGFYRAVVKPYCTTCHLAARPEISFSSWTNFEQNKALIYSAVCQQKTMPHAEIPFRQFWTKDTGLLFLPGLLAATLGYPGC